MTHIMATTSEAAAIWFQGVIEDGRYQGHASGGKEKVLSDLVEACETDRLQLIYPIDCVRLMYCIQFLSC